MNIYLVACALTAPALLLAAVILTVITVRQARQVDQALQAVDEERAENEELRKALHAVLLGEMAS